VLQFYINQPCTNNVTKYSDVMQSYLVKYIVANGIKTKPNGSLHQLRIS